MSDDQVLIRNPNIGYLASISNEALEKRSLDSPASRKNYSNKYHNESSRILELEDFVNISSLRSDLSDGLREARRFITEKQDKINDKVLSASVVQSIMHGNYYLSTRENLKEIQSSELVTKTSKQFIDIPAIGSQTLLYMPIKNLEIPKNYQNRSLSGIISSQNISSFCNFEPQEVILLSINSSNNDSFVLEHASDINNKFTYFMSSQVDHATLWGHQVTSREHQIPAAQDTTFQPPFTYTNHEDYDAAECEPSPAINKYADLKLSSLKPKLLSRGL